MAALLNILIFIQILLIGLGCYQITNNNLANGLFLIIINTIFLILNIRSLIKL